MNRTLIIVKPDAVERGLLGEILSRFERRGLKFIKGRFETIDKTVAEKHYAEHASKPFYEELVGFITRGPSFVSIVEGPDNTWKIVREMMGQTDPSESAPGTIRGDFGLSITENLIHGSDSAESAEREIEIFFAR